MLAEQAKITDFSNQLCRAEKDVFIKFEELNQSAKWILGVKQLWQKWAVQEYRDTAEGLHVRLDATISNLIPGNFSGSAATGFNTFYNETIQQVIGET